MKHFEESSSRGQKRRDPSPAGSVAENDSDASMDKLVMELDEDNIQGDAPSNKRKSKRQRIEKKAKVTGYSVYE